jgi:hypothetical protein
MGPVFYHKINFEIGGKDNKKKVPDKFIRNFFGVILKTYTIFVPNFMYYEEIV